MTEQCVSNSFMYKTRENWSDIMDVGDDGCYSFNAIISLELSMIMLCCNYRTVDIGVSLDLRRVHNMFHWYIEHYTLPDVHEMGTIILHTGNHIFEVVKQLKPRLLDIELTVDRDFPAADLDCLNPTNLETLSVTVTRDCATTVPDLLLLFLQRLPLRHINLYINMHEDNAIIPIPEDVIPVLFFVDIINEAFRNLQDKSANISLRFNSLDESALNNENNNPSQRYHAEKNRLFGVHEFSPRNYDMKNNIQGTEVREHYTKLKKRNVEIDFVMSYRGFDFIVNCNKLNNPSPTFT